MEKMMALDSAIPVDGVEEKSNVVKDISRDKDQLNTDFRHPENSFRPSEITHQDENVSGKSKREYRSSSN
jgi:hypothetical protein